MKKIFTLLLLALWSISSSIAQDKLSILLVQDNSADPVRLTAVKAAIDAAGYTYTVFDAAADKVAPSYEVLSNYELVLWYAGNDQTCYFWNGNETVNQALKMYLDNGGMLWLQSLEFLYNRYKTTPVSFVTGDFEYDYLGIKTYVERAPGNNDVTIGVPQFDLVEGNGITTVNPLLWVYATMWRVEALEKTDNAKGVYKIGPTTHTLSAYYTGIYNEKTNGFKTFTLTTETGKLKDAANHANPLFLQTLGYFNTFGNSTKIDVTGFDISITNTNVQLFSSVQLSLKNVLPAEADNKSVTWKIVSGSASAKINQNGLLTTTTTPGAVVVSATTNDGSNITKEITLQVKDKISILLVNDAGTYTGAEIIADGIAKAGFRYTLFDAVAQKTSPTASFMQNYDLVVWYTGKNPNTYFWDETDNTNLELKNYLDNGGMLWLQGRDFLFDKYGTAPDDFVAGDFAYDYLGIKKYFAQSKSDDGTASGVAQLDVVASNGICTLSPVYGKFATIWYADACELTDNAKGIYKMGPESYIFSSYYTCFANNTANAKIVSFAFETAELKAPDEAYKNPLFVEVLNYFDAFVTEPKVYVSSVNVTASGDAIVLGLNESLQMSASITPTNASNLSVTWSLNIDAHAKINTNGLLTATDIPETVEIKATANDGTGFSDTYSVEIKSLVEDSISILLVHDNSSDITRIEKIKSAIEAQGYKYTYFDAIANKTAPTAEYLSNFELVIWYTGNDESGLYLWNENKTDNQALKTYLDNGGMLWLQGLNFLYDRYGTAPVSFTETDFASKYLGISKFATQSYIDDNLTGVLQLDVVAANGICTQTPLTWLSSDSPMWFVDGCELTTSSKGVYKMGPASYVLSNYFSGIYNELENSYKALTFTFEPARLNEPTASNIEPLYKEILDYFNTFGNKQKSHVYELNVASTSGAISILDENGTLQMQANILPVNADNKTVTWSLTANSVPATITHDGLLKASGTIEGNGSVWVVATSNDKPQIADTLEISIIGQAMTGFTVLLVNDNSNNTRYLNIQTALQQSGYTYITFDAASKGFAPDFDYLKNFEMVFWYTGNNGMNLKLWDVSDTLGNGGNAVKANPAIIQYLNNGGIFYVNGIDMMYDIFSSKTTDFVAGNFIYDYMGISKYIQTGKDALGIASIDKTANNIINTTASLNFAWATLIYGDGFGLTDKSVSLYNFPNSANAWSGMSTVVMNKPTTGGTIITNGNELAMLGNGTAQVQSTVNLVVKEYLDYFSLPNNIYSVENELIEMIAFPNPVHSILNLNFKIKNSEKVEISIFDNLGRKVLSNKENVFEGENTTQLDVSNLSSGIYILNIRSSHSVGYHKFIKE